MNNVAIITAGGVGLRMPGEVKKQFRLLDGKPVLIHTLETFLNHDSINMAIVTLPEDDIDYFKSVCEQYLSVKSTKKEIIFCKGGPQRQVSVFEALKLCPEDTDIVLIQDGVRPFATAALIDSLLSLTHDFGAAIPGAYLKNTIKTVNGKIIDHTLRRDKLLQVYTPQVFSFPLIMKCYQKAMTELYYSTDDAALLEHYGYSVYFFNDNSYNLKITDELDLFLAEQYLRYLKLHPELKDKA